MCASFIIFNVLCTEYKFYMVISMLSHYELDFYLSNNMFYGIYQIISYDNFILGLSMIILFYNQNIKWLE